jgi:hypothetical protein
MRRVHIESLMLDGFPTESIESIQRAVRETLARLVDEGPATDARIASMAYLDGGTIHLEPGESPRAIGARIALAVYSTLTRSTTR